MNKEDLRRIYKKKRADLPKEYCVNATKSIVKKLRNFFINKPPSYISSFVPIGTEINLLNFNKYVIESKHTLLLPKTQEDRIFFVKASFYNIIPYEDKQIIPDFCIMPCICYDKRGHRIGYGKGFYDRFLRDKQNIFKIIPNYELLECENNILNNKWDVQADLILKE